LDYWGYDSRKEHFQYYDSIGLRNVMAIIGFPSETARDPALLLPQSNGANCLTSCTNRFGTTAKTEHP
jgi:hypothetical protein